MQIQIYVAGGKTNNLVKIVSGSKKQTCKKSYVYFIAKAHYKEIEIMT